MRCREIAKKTGEKCKRKAVKGKAYCAGHDKTRQKKLTAKQEKFKEKIIEGKSGADAAREAGYSEKTAKQIASENLTKPYLLKAIDEQRQFIMQQSNTNKREIIGTLVSHMRGNVANFMDDKGFFDLSAMKMQGHLVKKIKITERYHPAWVAEFDEEGNKIGGDIQPNGEREVEYQLELYDAQAAAAKLVEVFGLKKPTANVLELAAQTYNEMRVKYQNISDDKIKQIVAETYNIEISDLITLETVQ